jgi:mRNA-degrading endonuclease toxin of MazEF toxin-antitoxin module
VNRGDVFTHKGLGRAGYVVIVSNDGFSAVTGHPVVVRISDRPDLTETPYVVALTSDDRVAGHLESYSVLRVRRDRLGAAPVGRVSAPTLRKLDDALSLLFDHGALAGFRRA